MLAARAKERRRIAGKMPAGGMAAVRSATKISACPASRAAVEIVQSLPPLLKTSRCPQWTCDVFSVSWATSSATEFHLRNLLPARVVVTDDQLYSLVGQQRVRRAFC